jgi:histidinol-phosphate aminotransferase
MTTTAQPAPPVLSDHPDDADALRLHCNESPYGPPPEALAAAGEELAARGGVYPDPGAVRLRARIAETVGVDPAQVAVGNGADELILLTALGFLGPGRTALVTETTFPGYAASARTSGATVRTVPLAGYAVDVPAVCAALREGVDVAFFCNPLNPTGTALAAADVEQILATAEETGTLAVFDEAYLEFAGTEHRSATDLVRAGRRLLVLRTFSKAWGLAGLRIGYALGPAEVTGHIRATRQVLPFGVNRVAQRAAEAALEHPEFVADVRERTAEARELLYKGLEQAGLDFVRSQANFVLVRTGGDSAAIAERLRVEHRVLVRDLTGFGLPGHLRLGVGTPEQVDRACAALAAVTGPPREGQRAGGIGSPLRDTPVPTLAPVDPATLFNGYTGASVVLALSELGVWERLAERPAGVDELVGMTGADPTKLLALLRVAALLGHLELGDGDPVALTDTGREIATSRGVFTWGVGGYGELLGRLAGLATGELRFGRDVGRDEARIATGSGTQGRLVMRPAEQRVLAGIDFDVVADLGCGDGSRLIRLCGADPARRGLGIEVSPAAAEQARLRIAEAGLTDRLEIVVDDVLSQARQRTFPGVDLVTSFLMLHDLFAETGDPVGVMRALREVFPDARQFLVADSMARNWERHEGALPTFAVEFELVHAFMETPIMSQDVYERAFTEAGLRVRRREPLGTPSTWIYLLSTD